MSEIYTKQYTALTYLIPELEATKEFATMVFDHKHTGSREDPMCAPYVKYVGVVDAVCDAMCELAKPTQIEYRVAEIFQKYGIDRKHLEDTDVSNIPAEGILAMISFVFATERFHMGYIARFFKRGYVLEWIKRLQKIDSEVKED